MAKKTKKEIVPKEYDAEASQQVVDAAAQEIEDAVVELGTRATLSRLEMFWVTGETLRRYSNSEKASITSLVVQVSADNRVAGVHMSQRSLWFAVKVYDTFPAGSFEEALDEIPGGKSATVTKIKKLLVAPEAKVEPTIAEVAERIIARFGPEYAAKLVKELTKLLGRIKK